MNTILEDLSEREMHYMKIIKDLIHQERGLSHSLRKRRQADIEAARQWLKELPAEDTVKVLGSVLL